METKRFNDLMLRYPNWISEGPDNQVYTFFGQHYTRYDENKLVNEEDGYWLEQSDDALIIELEGSGKRYTITERWENETPILEFTPVDSSGNESFSLVPKNLKVKEASQPRYH